MYFFLAKLIDGCLAMLHQCTKFCPRSTASNRQGNKLRRVIGFNINSFNMNLVVVKLPPEEDCLMLPGGVITDHGLEIAGKSIDNCLDMALQSLNDNIGKGEIVLLRLC